MTKQGNPEKTGRKSYLVQDIVSFSFVALAASIGATQFIADRFHYHPALGTPLLEHVYFPWSWMVWRIKFQAEGAQTFALVDMGMTVIGALMLYGYMNLASIRKRSPQPHLDIHGTAHFATEAQILESGLLAAEGEKAAGVYVGGWEDSRGRLHYLRHDGPEHVAALAPTRSGKGVGLVLPTLLSWPHSVIVNDLKGELWGLTAGWRQKHAGNKVLNFDPASAEGSCCFNPLDEIRLGTLYEVGDVQNLVTIIIDPDGKGLTDHWTKTAHAFLSSVILHLMYQARGSTESASLYDLYYAIVDPARPIKELFEEMVGNTHVADRETGECSRHDTIAAGARKMMDTGDKERASIISSAIACLTIYSDPLVRKNTSRSDFKIRDLMNHESPVTLYLVVNPDNKNRLKPLMRLVLNQIIQGLTRERMKFEDGKAVIHYKHRLLLMLDEFPSFGKLEIFQEALAFIAGYGIKAYLIMQGVEQLYAAYGQDESILTNCHIRIAYAPNQFKSAEWLSKMLGQITVNRKDRTISGKRLAGFLHNVTESFQASSRPLMTPDEVMRMPGPKKEKTTGKILHPGQMIIFSGGGTPIKGTQILHFRDEWFLRASKIPAPEQTDVLITPEKPGMRVVPVSLEPKKEESAETQQTPTPKNEPRKLVLLQRTEGNTF